MHRTITQPERITITESIDRLDVWIISGRLNIVATPGPCRVEVNAPGSRPLRVSVDNGRLHVGHSGGWPRYLFAWRRSRYRCQVTIGVPADLPVSARVSEGNVTVSGLKRDTRVVVTSGRVSLLGLGGRSWIKLVSGDIEALRVEGDLFLKTISGDVALAESAARKLWAKTISGDITCDLIRPSHNELFLKSTSGDITVRLPDKSDLGVRLRTASGRIRSAFAGLAHADRPWASRASGKLGDGSGTLVARTTSGDVSLLVNVEPEGAA